MLLWFMGLTKVLTGWDLPNKIHFSAQWGKKQNNMATC